MRRSSSKPDVGDIDVGSAGGGDACLVILAEVFSCIKGLRVSLLVPPSMPDATGGVDVSFGSALLLRLRALVDADMKDIFPLPCFMSAKDFFGGSVKAIVSTADTRLG